MTAVVTAPRPKAAGERRREIGAQLLEQAAAFPDAAWTQQVLARNAAGLEVHYNNPSAVAYCALGRLHHTLHQAGKEELALLLRAAMDAELPGTDLIPWNDAPTRTAGEVRSLFQAAAERLRSPDVPFPTEPAV